MISVNWNEVICLYPPPNTNLTLVTDIGEIEEEGVPDSFDSAKNEEENLKDKLQDSIGWEEPPSFP